MPAFPHPQFTSLPSVSVSDSESASAASDDEAVDVNDIVFSKIDWAASPEVGL